MQVLPDRGEQHPIIDWERKRGKAGVVVVAVEGIIRIKAHSPRGGMHILFC
jgi:hypothetical protein